MSTFFRRRIEATIEHMIATLDELDGDLDLEPEPPEEQGDREADDSEAGLADKAALSFVLAETAKRKRCRR